MEEKDLNELSDSELICLARDKQNEKSVFAEEDLIARYKPLVIKLARKYFLSGGELEDLIAEGTIGVAGAIASYNEKKDASFSTFCYLCVTRKLINAVKSSLRQKNLAMNNAVPLADDSRYVSSPEEEYLLKEEEEKFYKMLKEILSKFEYEVLNLYLEGKNYYEIAEILLSDYKSVDNALFRARKKIVRR